jgi:hypothetical protein
MESGSARWLDGWSAAKYPDKMMASHFTNGVVYRVAAYKGRGSTDDAATFVCKTP